VILLSLVLLSLTGCGKPDPKDRPLRPEQQLDFNTLFTENCAGCHESLDSARAASGKAERGKGGPAPPLNDPLFLKIVTDSELEAVIRGGRPGTLMPAFGEPALVQPAKAPKTTVPTMWPVTEVRRTGALTDKQIMALVQGIRGWGKPDPALAKQFGKLLEKNLPGDREAGAIVFKNACASCHGENGKGGRAGALNDPAFLALVSDQELRRLIFTGRPDLKRKEPRGSELSMPSYLGTVGLHEEELAATGPEKAAEKIVEQIADVVALMASWRQRY
jgi:mono/diheme cytochrome c family protein